MQRGLGSEPRVPLSAWAVHVERCRCAKHTRILKARYKRKDRDVRDLVNKFHTDQNDIWGILGAKYSILLQFLKLAFQ